MFNIVNFFAFQDDHYSHRHGIKAFPGPENGIWALNTNSPYLACAVAGVLIVVLILVLMTRQEIRCSCKILK